MWRGLPIPSLIFVIISPVTFDITLSPDCYEPRIFLNSIINMILYCKRELARIESAEAKAQAPHTSIRKEAA